MLTCRNWAAMALAWLLLVAPAPACPVCDRETGRQVRAGIFDADFAFNLLATVLPFGIFLGITAAIHGRSPAPNRRDTPEARRP